MQVNITQNSLILHTKSNMFIKIICKTGKIQVQGPVLPVPKAILMNRKTQSQQKTQQRRCHVRKNQGIFQKGLVTCGEAPHPSLFLLSGHYQRFPVSSHKKGRQLRQQQREQLPGQPEERG